MRAAVASISQRVEAGLSPVPQLLTTQRSDSAGLTNCNVFNGIASSRCDYASSVGTVSFAAGETSKSFSIPLVDDSFAEGSENFIITLSIR